MIVQNELECRKCGDRIYSASVHDFKTCKCGAVSVDGGMEYLRRVGDFASAKDLSVEIDTEIVKKARAEIEKVQSRGSNSLGIFCAVVRVLRDANLLK